MHLSGELLKMMRHRLARSYKGSGPVVAMCSRQLPSASSTCLVDRQREAGKLKA